jgi:hypothetical protein
VHRPLRDPLGDLDMIGAFLLKRDSLRTLKKFSVNRPTTMEDA